MSFIPLGLMVNIDRRVRRLTRNELHNTEMDGVTMIGGLDSSQEISYIPPGQMVKQRQKG